MSNLLFIGFLEPRVACDVDNYLKQPVVSR
jgi:hypothetical protein